MAVTTVQTPGIPDRTVGVRTCAPRHQAPLSVAADPANPSIQTIRTRKIALRLQPLKYQTSISALIGTDALNIFFFYFFTRYHVLFCD